MVNHYMSCRKSLDFCIGWHSIFEHPTLNLRLLEIGILALLVIGKFFLARQMSDSTLLDTEHESDL